MGDNGTGCSQNSAIKSSTLALLPTQKWSSSENWSTKETDQRGLLLWGEKTFRFGLFFKHSETRKHRPWHVENFSTRLRNFWTLSTTDTTVHRFLNRYFATILASLKLNSSTRWYLGQFNSCSFQKRKHVAPFCFCDQRRAFSVKRETRDLRIFAEVRMLSRVVVCAKWAYSRTINKIQHCWDILFVFTEIKSFSNKESFGFLRTHFWT